MLGIHGCIAFSHDLRLVLLAAVVALFGAFTAIGLLRHVVAVSGGQRRFWLVATAIAAGTTIWATHFVAMLAFTTSGGIATYDPGLTIASLVAALAITGSGFGLATRHDSGTARVCGGSVVGGGIGVMHYIGMAGYLVPGAFSWNVPLVVASILTGCGFSALAVCMALTRSGWRSRIAAALVFTLAICAAHFLGMAALSFTLAGDAVPAVSTMSPTLLGIAVAVAGVVLIALAMGGLEFERRMVFLRQREIANLNDFADIAVEGLAVCDDCTIVAANSSLYAISGYPTGTLHGAALASLFVPLQAGRSNPPQGVAQERALLHVDGDSIPVEVVQKQILYAGRPHMVVAVRDLRERRGAERTIRFLAHHDALTGLHNRASFNDRLAEKCGEAPLDFAVLMIDLDRFKAINDTQGHPFGDLLLTCVADRLRDAVRKDDLVARLGGDEFAILRVGSAGVADMAARVVEVVREPYIIEGKYADIGASIGVATAPHDGRDPAELMRNADTALYTAKTDGRNRSVLFEPVMGLKVQALRKLEIELRQAIPRQEIVVFYQPLFTYSQDRVTSFEALVRWQHPERGLIGPSEFLDVAEATGLIVPIGEFVLHEACREAAKWDAIGIAVNLAPAQFEGDGPVAAVRAALAQSGLKPNLLELEVTERVLLHGSEHAVGMLHQLHALGVRVSIDDFGTGHSSLTQLRSFPFDKIKIDRSFVAAPDSDRDCAAIVEAVVGLGRNLNIVTTAEGVETAEQMERMREQGCDSVQGYLIGRPMPALEALSLLQQRRPDTALRETASNMADVVALFP